MSSFSPRRRPLHRVIAWGTILVQLAGAVAAEDGTPPLVHRVDATEDRIEMTVNTSRILTLEKNIPKAQINNPDILDLKPVGAKQVQIHAKKPGITQVNLWDEEGKIHAIDIVIFGDVKELTSILKSQFPEATVRVVPTSNGIILTGFVDKAESVERIMEIAQDYFPKVINNITVGGTQQVMLHVKVMEVSRTKLRDLGFDFADLTSDGSFVVQGVSGLIQDVSGGTVTTSGQETFAFGIVDGNNAFFGVLAALQQNNIAKLLAEPTLVTVSGRPAYFQSGGEIPVLIPQGLGNVSVEFRPFGTQVDFVPIVLGDGQVRLEVRPRVSEIDRSLSVTLNGSSIPGFRTRQVDTGVVMRVGQTLAIAGLIQTRIEASKRGLPWVSDLPYLGVPFRRITETVNEIELLVMVRPELAEALDPEEVPPCGPGESTISPNDCELLLKGHLEVPNPRCLGGECANGGCTNGQCTEGGPRGTRVGAPHGTPPNSRGIPEGAIIEDVPAPRPSSSSRTAPAPTSRWTSASRATAPSSTNRTAAPPASNRRATSTTRKPTPPAAQEGAARYNPPVVNARPSEPTSNGQSGEPGLIGPTGYDVIN